MMEGDSPNSYSLSYSLSSRKTPIIDELEEVLLNQASKDSVGTCIIEEVILVAIQAFEDL